MIFDSHAHVVSDDMTRYPPAPLSGSLDRPLDNPNTAEKLLRSMDELKIGRAVIVQRAHVYGYDNTYVCDSAHHYRDRLVAVCCIDAQAADAAERAQYWLGEREAAGLRLTEPFKGANTDWFAGAAAQPVWELANRLGASICLHMYRWNRVETLEQLPPILERYSKVQVILDHVSNLAAESGPPDYGIDAILVDLVHYSNLFQKFTTINFGKLAAQNLPAAPVVKRVVAEFGARRVMWGSDVAQSAGTYPELLALADTAFQDLTASERAAVLFDSCDQVYGGRWRAAAR
jgi:predicted TIM-barrel fold metal-dependent hydrolase